VSFLVALRQLVGAIDAPVDERLRVCVALPHVLPSPAGAGARVRQAGIANP